MSLMITQVPLDIILPIWKHQLWADRITPIPVVSAMLLNGGYDGSIQDAIPYFWAMYDDNRVVGVNSGHIAGDYAFRSRGLWVHEQYRRIGIAQQLFQSLAIHARTIGCTSMWSYPRHAALTTYEKFGFTVTSPPVIETNNIYSPHFYVSINLYE